MNIQIKTATVELSNEEIRALRFMAKLYSQAVTVEQIRTATPEFNNQQDIISANKLAEELKEL